MNILTQLNGLLQSNGGSMADLNTYMLLQSANGILDTIGLLIIPAAVIIGVGTAAYWASRYKKCPSNKIPVSYTHLTLPTIYSV